jgi:hypothetical protein
MKSISLSLLTVALLLGLAAGLRAAAPATGTIPRDLPECFTLLNQQLQPADIQRVRDGQSSPHELQQRFGQQLLQLWILPDGSPLRAYFVGLGIDHPQDMIDIVLGSYDRYLRGQAINLPRQIRYRTQYWQNLATPEKVAAAQQLWNVARTDKPLLAAAYSAAAVLVAQDFDGSQLNHPALTRGLVQQAWDSLGDFVAWRAGRPLPRAAPAYAEALSELGPRPSTTLTQLDPRTTIISVGDAGIGHVMIFTQARDHIDVWHIDTAAPKTGEGFAALSCWTPLGDRGRPCSPNAIGVLPDNAAGAHRFYVNAGYAQAAGGTRGSQLSIWRWNGHAAEPLYVESYVTGGDAPAEGASVAGDVIRIGKKARYQTLDPCGACDGSQQVERLAVTADDHIDNLGTVSLTPELDLLDQIYTRVRQNQDVGELASQAALTVIERSWQPMIGREVHNLFINEAETATHDNGRTQLCFRAHYGGDAAHMPPILFTFAGSGSQLHVTAAQQVSGCGPT